MPMFRGFGKSSHDGEPELTESPTSDGGQNRSRRSFSESDAGYGSPNASKRTFDPHNVPPTVAEHIPVSLHGQSDEQAYGLTPIHEPKNRNGDIIFVHGLGGSCRKSWSYQRDPAYFWPTWLNEDRELAQWRIFTYGYNSSFSDSDAALNISDFANNLLLWIQTYESDGEQPAPLGTLPMCFVAHSMGGLVVKKAYYLGKYHDKYRAIVEQIHSIIFLGTPHRGTKFADMLNNILAVSPLIANRKIFIQEIERYSSSLQDINEQFGKVCEGLALYSFWETKKTNIVPAIFNKLIVDKDSAIMGIPHETASALEADHFSISKFKSPNDSNYKLVKNVMRDILPSKPSSNLSASPKRDVPTSQFLDTVLGLQEASNADFEGYIARSMAGTCQWILKRPNFAQWLQPNNRELRTFWLTGLPATGKSTVASFVVSHLQEHFGDASCQYHFFTHDSPEKRTVGYCLRSLVYQLAQSDDIFCQKLEEYHAENGISFSQHKTSFVWRNLFMDFIFAMKLSKPLFWIIDALDECESPATLVEFINQIPDGSQIKVIIFSRPDQALQGILTSQFVVEEMTDRDTFPDMRAYVEDVVSHNVPSDPSVSGQVADQILSKSNGSFLWVRLTLDTLKDNWHTKGDIHKALNNMPAGMEPLYKKLMEKVSAHEGQNRPLALRIITWAACSYRPLQVKELEEALKPEFDDFLRFEDSIIKLCGHFIKIERGRLLLIHETAFDFLFRATNATDSPIGTASEAHQRIALACLQYLSNDSWRTTLGKLHASVNDAANEKRLSVFGDHHAFLNYAIRFWAFHVSCSPSNSQELLATLSLFLKKYALQWMHAVALSQDLRVFTKTAQHLKAYSKKCHRAGLPDPPTTLRPIDTQFLSLWSCDLIHLVGKFGGNMQRNPISLYTEIPSFCPVESQIYKNYASSQPLQSLSVKGVSNNGWDDCVSRINVGDGHTIERVACTAKHILTLVSGTCQLMVWDADTSELVGVADHQDEWFILMAINARRTHVVTATGRAYRVWEIATQREVSYLPRYYEAKPLAIRFLSDYHTLLVGYDDYTVWRGSSYADGQEWISLDLKYEDGEDYSDEDYDSPRIMAFSPDGSHVAVALSGRPIEVWDLSVRGKQTPLQFTRSEDRYKGRDSVWNYAEEIRWTPEGDMLLILYQDTKLVSWRLFAGTDVDFDDFGAREMVISDNGLVLLTSDYSGSLSVWSMPRIQLMFKLHYPSLVRDLSISPIGHRLFDARDSFCHVWEPEFLIRSDDLDQEDHSSTIGSTIGSEPIHTNAYSSIDSQVFSVACDASDEYFCCGNEDGVVTINEMKNGDKLRIVYRHADSMTITSIAWSKSRRYMVSGDDSGRIITKQLKSKGKEKNKIKGKGKDKGKEGWAVYPCLDFRVQTSVKQLLFSPGEEYLLCVSEKSARVWDLRRKKLVNVQRFPLSEGRWINHPADETLLVWLDATRLLVRQWCPDTQGLEVCEDGETPLLPAPAFARAADSPERDGDGERAQEVTWLAQPLMAPSLVYQRKRRNGGGAADRLRAARGVLEAVDMHDVPREAGTHAVPRHECPVSAHVSRVVGLYRDAVVYLDELSCLSSWKLGAPAASRRHHFYLPKDWLSHVNQQPVLLNEQGTLLCARNADVAIIRNGMT